MERSTALGECQQLPFSCTDDHLYHHRNSGARSRLKEQARSSCSSKAMSTSFSNRTSPPPSLPAPASPLSPSETAPSTVSVAPGSGSVPEARLFASPLCEGSGQGSVTGVRLHQGACPVLGSGVEGSRSRSCSRSSLARSKPLSGSSSTYSFKDHARHHTVSGVPPIEPRSNGSPCVSSCSASSTSSSCNSFSSPPSSAFFSSPSTPRDSLFGHHLTTSSVNHVYPYFPKALSSASDGTCSLPPTTPSRDIPPSAASSTSMRATRQTRSASCTPAFPLTALSIPKDLPKLSGAAPMSASAGPMGFLWPARGSHRAASETCPLDRIPERPNHRSTSRKSPRSSQRSLSVATLTTCHSTSAPSHSPFSPTTPSTTLPPRPFFSESPTVATASSNTSSFFPYLQEQSSVSQHHHRTDIQRSNTVSSVSSPISMPTQRVETGGLVTAFHPHSQSSAPHSFTHTLAHSHPHSQSYQAHLYPHTFEEGSCRLEMSLPPARPNCPVPIVLKSCSSSRSNYRLSSLVLPPASPMGSSFNSESGFLGGSRRSSKDSVDSAPGVTLDYLVDQLTIPDYVNSIEQIARTKIFLMIYRKFLRPRELLEMFIERFEELGEFVDEDDEEAKNTRLRICACLYYWLKNHPNDLIHRQTRQRVALFLRERVGLFPFLHEIYVKLLPLSSIHYFNSWRWPQGQPSRPPSQCQSRVGMESRCSRSSSISGPAVTMGSFSDEDSDSGFYDAGASAAATSITYEHDMDEDKEWGLFDEDEALPEAKLKTLSMDSLAPFSYHSMGRGCGMSGNSYRRQSPSRSYTNLAPPRDRRSSTGSLAQQSSPCEMGAFVASRRGSASSINSGQGQSQQQLSTSSIANSTLGSAGCFPEGDPTPLQLLQPMTPIPFISKRGSSHAYRQHQPQRLQPHQGIVFSGPSSMGHGSFASKEIREDTSVHPLQGRASPLPPPPTLDFSSMNTPFIDIKDSAIAAQLTCVEFGLFKKLKPRDMLRQVWKSSKGSAAFQACIAHFNFISSWVGTMILSPSKAKNRAKMMEKFITIAKILRDMGNFNTTMAIIGALNTSSIHRLVQTRELLQGKEIWNTFKGLEHLMSSERSFFEYRSALKVQKLPCIPYLGVHLGDLLSISEGNRDFRQDGTIHWQKFCLLAEVISKVMHFQSEPYMIQPDPFISRVITETHVLDDEEMYTKSIGTEPGKLQHSRSMSKFNFF